MAIIPLKKVSLFCMKKDAGDVLRALQERGLLHMIPTSADMGLGQISLEKKSAEMQGLLDNVVFALEFSKKYDKTKTSILQAKPSITAAEYKRLPEQLGLAQKAFLLAKEMDDNLAAIRMEIQKKQNISEALLPFAGMNMPLSVQTGTKSTRAFLGFIQKDAAEAAKNGLKQIKLLYCEFYPPAGDIIPVAFIVHCSKAAEMQEMLKSNGFIDARLESVPNTPGEYAASLEEEIKALEMQRAQTLESVGELLAQKQLLLAMEDYLRSELARLGAFGSTVASQSVVLIEGYIKHYEKEKLETVISSVSSAFYLECADPAADDPNLPTAVENNALVTPFEAVTDMYSVPGPRTIDTNAVMMPFYFMFFGMMVSDAAYGLILTIGSILFLKLKKPDGTFKKIVTVIGICGISTLIWGSGFGGWMGFTLHGWLFDPMTEPLKMLILCLSLGVIHLLAGLIMGAYMNFKHKRFFDAVCDQFFWIMILACIPFFVLNGTQTVGIVLLAGGAIGIVATAGRHNKRFIKKIMGGLSALYGITGYLSDILSYARLFGMALATSVIAMVFNTIAGMMVGSIPGFLFAIIIFLIGHLFNIGINALGAFVHSARLQYIEFFSKFYEGGGIPFKPLKIQLKNMRMVK